MCMQLRELNNLLVLTIVIVLLVIITRKVMETFAADTEECNAIPHGNPNVAMCTNDTLGQVVTDENTGKRYLCGQTDGYGFLCQ